MPNYYYRPVAPYSGGGPGVAAGIASGIAQGTENFFGARAAGRAEKRQEEEDLRRRTREDAEDAWRTVEQDMAMIEMGGGRGRPPGSQDLQFGGMGLAQGSRGKSPLVGLPEIELEPQEGILARMDRESGGRSYRTIGDFYIEEPESRARRLRADERSEKDTDFWSQYTREEAIGEQKRTQQQGRIGELLTGGRGNMTPDRAAGLITEGVADFDDLYPDTALPFDPANDAPLQRDRAMAQFYLDAGFGPTGSRLDTRAPGDATRAPTVSQAFEMLKERYSIYDTNSIGEQIWSGYEKSEDEIYEEALELARGGTMRPGTSAPARGGGGGGGSYLEQFMAPFGGARSGGGPAGTKQTITKDQADYLREVQGMSPAEINRRYTVRP